MRARLLAALAATGVVAAGLPLVGSGSAGALESPVAFTATALPTYQTDGVAWAVASAGGKVFVGGSFSHVRPAGTNQGDVAEVARSNFVVLDAATGAPTPCAPEALLGTAAAATVRSLAVSPDGQTLYVGGTFSTFGGANKGNLAALDIASCTVVSSFTPAPTGRVKAIAVSPDNTTVYYGGAFTSVNTGGVTTARTHAAAAVAVGQPNPGSLKTWAPATTSTVDPTHNLPDVDTIAVKPDGSEVLLGGDFEDVNGTHSHGIVGVDNAAGAVTWALTSPPWTTGSDSLGYTSAVKSIVVDANGFYTGNEGTGSGSFDGRTAWGWDHVLRWKDACLGATQALVLYSSALYSASHAHNCSLIGAYPDGARHHLLADSLTADPTSVGIPGQLPYPTLLPFFPNTNDGDITLFPRETALEGIGPRGITVAHTAGQDYLYVVGEFSSVNGVIQQGITRFDQSPSHDAQPSLPVVSASSFTPGQVRVTWLPSVDNDDATLTYTVERSADLGQTWAAISDATSLSQQSWFWQRPQMVYTDTNVVMGATYKYRVKVSDGTVTRTSGERLVVVTNTGIDLGGGNYGPSPYEAAVLADNPELYLRYDEIADVFVSDRSPNRDNLVLKGAGQFGPGLLGSDSSHALTLTGSAGQVLYSQKLLDSPTNYSLETWFSTTTTAGGKLIGFGNKQDYSSNTFDKMVWMTNSGQLAFGVYTGAKIVLLSPLAYNDGSRHHVVATQSSTGGMSLYVDGALVASNTVKTNQVFKGYWHVGGDNLVTWSPAPTSYAFAGTLDETAVYPTALSASRVAAHFNARDALGSTVAVLTPQKPSVSLGSPVDGATVKGVVPVTVFGSTTPSTTSHPDTLELLVDGVSSPTYTFSCGQTGSACSTTFDWDAGGLLGSHTLAARITTVGGPAAPNDTASTTPINVTVQASAPPQAPNVNLSVTGAGAGLSGVVGPGSVDVHGSATTVTGTTTYPASLDLIVDGHTSAPVTSVPCSGTTYDCNGVLTWSTTGLFGAHTLQVRVNATTGCETVANACSSITAPLSVRVAAPTATAITPLKVVRSRTSATVSGRVTVPLSGLGAAGMLVKVSGTPAVGAPFSRTVTTNSTGYFATAFAMTTTTLFSAQALSTGWYLPSSMLARQYVSGVPSCRLSATTVKAGVRDVMTCRLAYLPTATAVSLQYAYRGKWRTLVSTTTRAGAAFISFAVRSRGTWYLRVVIGSNRVYYTSVGSTVRLRVV